MRAYRGSGNQTSERAANRPPSEARTPLVNQGPEPEVSEAASYRLDEGDRIMTKIEDMADDVPAACECDNTHEQLGAVCRWCWAHGRRKPTDPDVDSSRCDANA